MQDYVYDSHHAVNCCMYVYLDRPGHFHYWPYPIYFIGDTAYCSGNLDIVMCEMCRQYSAIYCSKDTGGDTGQ